MNPILLGLIASGIGGLGSMLDDSDEQALKFQKKQLEQNQKQFEQMLPIKKMSAQSGAMGILSNLLNSGMDSLDRTGLSQGFLASGA